MRREEAFRRIMALPPSEHTGCLGRSSMPLFRIRGCDCRHYHDLAPETSVRQTLALLLE